MTDSTPPRPTWGRILKSALKPLLIVIVVLGIGQSIRLAWIDLEAAQSKAYRRILILQKQLATANSEERAAIDAEITEIEQRQFSWKNIRWTIASGSVLLAFASLIPWATFWWLTLRSFDCQVPWLPTQAAYAAGNLGKYVPGKAMVLILRSGAMQRWGVPISTSIVSIFIETLTALAVGGALGALTLMALHPPAWLLWTAIGAAILSLAPTIPPVFRRVLVFLTRYRHLRLPKQLAHAMSWRLIASGWLLMMLGWLLLGSSLWVLCEVIRNSMEVESSLAAGGVTSLRLWWICMAATCLGFVIGFLSMLPGGAGVREVVVTMLLAPAIGYAPALAAAVLYRISSLLGELLMAGLTWWLARIMNPNKSLL